MYTLEDLFDKRSIVGSKLEQIFEQHGYTKAQICRESSISRPTLDKILSGMLTSKTNYEKHIIKILGVLSITPDMLLGNIQNKYIQARTIRNAMQISAEEIAKPAGISKERLQEIEAGEEATTAELRDIAVSLSTSVRSVLGTSCFETQIAQMDMILKAYNENAAPAGLSGFWGHVGILPTNATEYLWFPITGTTRKMIYKSMDMDRIVIPCMNNKVLLLNMQNIKEIILLDEACDQPSFTNWDPAVDCGGTPLAVYEALYDFNPFYDRRVSTDIVSKSFQASIEAYIKHKEWNENDIYAMLHENLIYHKDGHIERVDIDFDEDESVTSEVSQILDFADDAILHKFLYYTADDGIEVMLNMQNVSLIAMPLLKVEDAICSYLEELLDE